MNRRELLLGASVSAIAAALPASAPLDVDIGVTITGPMRDWTCATHAQILADVTRLIEEVCAVSVDHLTATWIDEPSFMTVQITDIGPWDASKIIRLSTADINVVLE